MANVAVILLNLGGPDSLAAVEPFLFNLFCDPDIFKIPFGQKLFARTVSRRRAPKVQERYRQIGGGSPINMWTERQRSMLDTSLKEEDPGVRVYTAMRYWHPLIRETAEAVAREAVEKILLLPLYPQYSITTTGSAFNEWKRVFAGNGAVLSRISAYHDHPGYISAVNERIDETLQRFPETVRDDVQIVFSAHGIPEKLVKRGDPYGDQIKGTAAAVMTARGFSHEHCLCFQSRVGPVKWLSPSIDETIRSLAADGRRHLLVVPVSFVSDHIETLYELGIEYRRVAEDTGIETYHVMEGLNDSSTFVNALRDIVLNELRDGALPSGGGRVQERGQEEK